MDRALMRALVGACRLIVAIASLSLIASAHAAAAPADPQVVAQYAVVVDADTGQVLFNKNMDTSTAPASLTKIFTAAVALDSAPLDKKLTVDKYDLVGESSMGLAIGDQVSLRTLLYGMLLPSGNDAAMTVAQGLGALPGDSPQQAVSRFVDRVNATAQRLGLQHTHLVNPHGLDQPGHQTSARDIAAMTMYALRNPEFRTAFGAPYYQAEGFQLYQVNKLVESYPGLVGGKTGITDNAGYCLVEVAQRNGHTVIAMLLKSTDAAWYQDARTLLDFGFSTLASGQAATGLPKITLAPVVPEVKPAAVETPAAGVSNLLVNQLSDTTAVVRHSHLGSASGFSWRWPAVSLITMIAALGLALNYPALLGLGGLLLQRSRATGGGMVGALTSVGDLPSESPSRKRRARRSSRPHRRGRRPTPIQAPATRSAEPVSWRVSASAFASASPVVSLTSAETIANRAVKLALRGDYRAASSEFGRALEADGALDLTRSPGFWSMQPAGYVSAARAYARRERTADARSLLTVVKLSCGSHRELESLLNEVVAPAR